MDNKKCCCLVRVSTDAQDLSQQTEKVKAEAIKDGFAESDIIVLEDKESAVKLSEEERNGLNKMKWHIENDNVVTVYTYEVSRISRRASVLYSIRDYLIEHHVQLIIMNPYIKMMKDDGTLSESANLFFGIFGSMAENEGYLRKVRFARGKQKKKAMGLFMGGPVPTGYRVEDKRLVVDEEQAEVIRYIYDKYVNENYSLNQLGWRLLEFGFRGCNKIDGARHYVRSLLMREYLCGDEMHPQIISRELFDKAQEKRKNKIWYRKSNDSVCKGLIIDKNTGYRLIANVAAGQYYVRSPKTDKSMASISILAADTLVGGLVTEWYNQIKVTKHNEFEENLRVQRAHYEGVIKNMENKINEISDKIDRIEERYIDGKISKQKADELEKKVFEMMLYYKNTIKDAQDKLVELSEVSELEHETIRDKAVYLIDRIYIKRFSKYVVELIIINKITGETRTYTYNTKVKKILNMKIKTRPTLNYIPTL